MNEPRVTPPAGIYVHVPFCVRKCSYCDFFSIADLSLKPAFLEALSSEIAAADPGLLVFDTICIGGGTPSILEPTEVKGIINGLFSKFRFGGAVEVTLEANPGTVDFKKLKGFRSAGVNRLNIGVQSFQEKNLALLGRIHSAQQSHAALSNARRAGFENVGLDLMFGLSGQALQDWSADLESALAHGPEHIACYMLTVEPATPLAEEQRLGRYQPAPEGDWPSFLWRPRNFLRPAAFCITRFPTLPVAGPAAARWSVSPGIIPSTGRMHLIWGSAPRRTPSCRRSGSGTTGMCSTMWMR
jgi:oxygen-independent coproporphyrinogen-3 oxidase